MTPSPEASGEGASEVGLGDPPAPLSPGGRSSCSPLPWWEILLLPSPLVGEGPGVRAERPTELTLQGTRYNCSVRRGFFSFSTRAAEKKKITYIKQSRQHLSQTIIRPGEVPNHELGQSVNMDVITVSDPDFKDIEDIEMMGYDRSDSIAGSGTHEGYWFWLKKDGDKIYGDFEGTHKTTVKEGGSWELTYEGKGRVTGGTGKFKNIKGTAIYKGKVTPKGFSEEGELEVEY